MSRLALYLDDVYYESMDITMPGHSDELDFEHNCEIRENHVRAKVVEFRILRTRAILQMKKEAKIYLVVESKMNLKHHE